MSFVVEERDVSVDLSKLISFNLNFSPLQLTLQEILKRLAALEHQNSLQSNEMAALRNELTDLRSQQQQEAEAERGVSKANEPCNSDDHDALWMEIDALKNIIGELSDNRERDRHTIDEFYAARKHQDQLSLMQSSLVMGGGAKDAVEPRQQQFAPQGIPSILGSGGKPPLPRSCHTPSVVSITPSPEDDLPLGDKLLLRAQEELPILGETKRPSTTSGFNTAELSRLTFGHRPASGEAMQPPTHYGSKLAAGRADESVDFGQNSVHVPSIESETRSEVAKGHSARPHSQGRQFSSGRRVSTVTLSAAYPGTTVSDKLKKDGDDIAYLNRVVAEILSVLRELQDKVKLICSEDEGLDAEGEGEALGDNSLRRRVAALQRQVNDLLNDLRVARRLKEEDMSSIREIPTLKSKLSALEKRIAAAESAAERADFKLSRVAAVAVPGGDDDVNAGGGSGGSGGANNLQIALMQGAVDGLEKQLADLQGSMGKDWGGDVALLEEALRRVRGDVETLEQAVWRNAKECARLDDVKANRDETGSEERLNSEVAAALDKLSHRIDELEDSKAGQISVRRINDDQNDIKRQLSELAQRCDQLESRGQTGANASLDADRLLLLQKQLAAQAEQTNASHTASLDEMEALRELLDQLDRRKADATLVANKAERDYVENALERLMREVEQVLNATNAGLIDTLDKSLNILRDMIDGKASKQDITQLQQAMADECGAHTAADTLTGFKGYRCLGCNRSVDTLRPRPLPPKMNPFLNRNVPHLPSDNVTRVISQERQLQQIEGQHSAPATGIEMTDGRGDRGGAGVVSGGASSAPVPRIDASQQ